jgi:predicted sugar kinase
MIEPEVNRIIRESLRAQEEALKIALNTEGLRFNKKTLKRIVRVKQVVTPIESGKYGFAAPEVNGCFVLDGGKESEKVLFFFREPTFKDPTFRVWFPEDVTVEVTVSPDVTTSFKMVNPDEAFIQK